MKKTTMLKNMILERKALVCPGARDAVSGCPPLISIDRLSELGVGKVSIPEGPPFAAVKGMTGHLDAIRGTGLRRDERNSWRRFPISRNSWVLKCSGSWRRSIFPGSWNRALENSLGGSEAFQLLCKGR